MLMTNQNCLTSACRYCRFYRPDGLHRGACQQLNVSVHSDWKACQLALPAFASSWENAEELTKVTLQVETSVVGLELTSTALSSNNSNN